MIQKIKEWKKAHPNIFEFVMFNILSNSATITNFVVLWICNGFIFKSFQTTPFQWFVFDYSDCETTLGLGGFLAFLVAYVCAQTVTYIVQRTLVFQSHVKILKTIGWFLLASVSVGIVCVALPAPVQAFCISIGIPRGLAPTLANIVNIGIQVAVLYPVMKFVVFPKEGETGEK